MSTTFDFAHFDPLSSCPDRRSPSDDSFRSLPPDILQALRIAEEPAEGSFFYNLDRRYHSRWFQAGANRYSILQLLANWRYGKLGVRLQPRAYWIDGDPTNERPENVALTRGVAPTASKPPKAPAGRPGRPSQLGIAAPAGSNEYFRQYYRIRRQRMIDEGLIKEQPRPTVTEAIQRLQALPTDKLISLLDRLTEAEAESVTRSLEGHDVELATADIDAIIGLSDSATRAD